MSELSNKIVRKMDITRIIAAVVMVLVGVGLVIWNFAPDESGTITVSFYMIALEAFLILVGGYVFFKSFKLNFAPSVIKH